ncbi:hypothetical protein F5Y15DRAFT_142677 [Xylariaceae sp. FL0016]|nr:hypothetical protein F5Y15DRAFT_142677 [Xylariaceae sp. FL0016]
MSVASTFDSLSPAEQQIILDSPSIAPPPGVVPDFVNPPNGNACAHAIIAVCLFLTICSATLRAYSRLRRLKRVWADDYIGLAAFGNFIGFIWVSYLLMTKVGYLVHQWNFRVRDTITVLYVIHLSNAFYCVTVALIKTAILREWGRIFVPGPTRTPFWWTCHALIFLNVSYYVARLFFEILVCSPQQSSIAEFLPGSVCLAQSWEVKDIVTSALNLVSDLIILLVSQRIIWRLQIPLRRKVGVSLVFLIGILGFVCTVIQLYTTLGWYSGYDETYAGSMLILTRVPEVTCMFLAFCIPAAPSVFRDSNLAKRVSTIIRSWKAPFAKHRTKGSCHVPSTTTTWLPMSYRRIDGSTSQFNPGGDE